MNDDVNQDHIEQEIISSNGLVLPDQQQPDKLYIIPVHNRPFFPAQVLPVIVDVVVLHCLSQPALHEQPGLVQQRGPYPLSKCR